MSEKRKDNKGRILRTGENQRKGLDLSILAYGYPWKTTATYSSDLKELREKEKQSKAST